MSELLHFEFPPPRSWEQFEELCADLFEVMWSDPGLVRHGRAGQTQHGVDIVAARGSVFPIGLQCKKKARWPAKKLTLAEIKAETEEADKFNPTLKEFYILTTALADVRLEEQIRTFNKERQKNKKFPVLVLPWSEIVRRVSRYEQVARKHFSLGSNGISFTPLLATWYTRDGKIEILGEDWTLAVQELGEDFHDWPSGHIVVRQHETDELLTKIRGIESAAKADRKRKLNMRRELRRARAREAGVELTIGRLYTHPHLKTYMHEVYEEHAPTILRSIIEFDLKRNLENAGECKIRLSPPSPERLAEPFSAYSVAKDDFALDMSTNQYISIVAAEKEFPKKFHGNRMAKIVMELPNEIQYGLAIPAILRRIERIMQDDKKTPQEMELAGYFDLGSWKYTH